MGIFPKGSHAKGTNMPQNYKRPRPVRLNEIEEKVDDYLKKSGETFSGLVKKSLMAYLESDRPKSEIPMKEIIGEFKKMRSDLARVGGNLNQLAYRFNTTGIVDDEALARNHQSLKQQFDVMVDQFRQIEQKITD